MNITVCLYIFLFFLSFLSFSSFHVCNLRIKYFPVEEGWPKTPIQFLNNYNSFCNVHCLTFIVLYISSTNKYTYFKKETERNHQ